MQHEPVLLKHMLHKEAETSAEPISSPADNAQRQRVPFPIILSTLVPKQMFSSCPNVFLPPSAGASRISAAGGVGNGSACSCPAVGCRVGESRPACWLGKVWSSSWAFGGAVVIRGGEAAIKAVLWGKLSWNKEQGKCRMRNRKALSINAIDCADPSSVVDTQLALQPVDPTSVVQDKQTYSYIPGVDLPWVHISAM